MTTHNSDLVSEELDLLVVGSGIAGLMTAYKARKAGMSVKLVSKSPDPRACDVDQIEHASSTFDGMDQRYITLFEGHPYLALPGYVDKMYPGIAEDFTVEVTRGGWLVEPWERLPERSGRWLEARRAINQELARGEPERERAVAELFASYADENRAAMVEWYELLGEIIHRKPDILDTLSLSYDGIVRLYDRADVFEQAVASHAQGNVLAHTSSTMELAERMPAYRAGVNNGFIRGGSVEMYGITLGVRTLSLALMELLEQDGVELMFEREILEVICDPATGLVTGLRDVHGTVHVAKSYAIHGGPFAGPELGRELPDVHGRVAAVEGYWIEIHRAEALIRGMGGKPNKVHGKQSLAELLDVVGTESPELRQECEAYFESVGIPRERFAEIALLVDFNIMPIYRHGQAILGVGSGYAFLGLSERDASGNLIFADSTKVRVFTQQLMLIWLVGLYGKALLEHGQLHIHKRARGCKRSWTYDDQELDANRPTAHGGLLMFHDGGNTGTTTKAPFIAEYVLEKIRYAQARPDIVRSALRLDAGVASADAPAHALNQLFERSLRTRLRKQSADITPADWQAKRERLHAVVTAARSAKKPAA